jgi:hypothetical protein
MLFVLALVPRKLSPIPILLATVLKLYPVFLLGILLIKRQKAVRSDTGVLR